MDVHTQEQKLNEVFSQENDETMSSLREHFNKLETLSLKEMRTWWEIASFEKYLSLKMIPRGLRIKKYPTFLTNDDECMDQWNKILSDCSLRLMALLIDKNRQTYDLLRNDISKIKK
ncbi:hypothetical protein XELAEV_18037207mg [Xenopus laevis]|uniref:Uncharacterized protein n=1 Tax=Xenopus laevis TaxID=8355 RepID=A0A974CBL6_XENLA|nr:hypothetical protein XELAEV_18037207mg [Xenopus laevis]